MVQLGYGGVEGLCVEKESEKRYGICTEGCKVCY
jgi:hypothetical protein